MDQDYRKKIEQEYLSKIVEWGGMEIKESAGSLKIHIGKTGIKGDELFLHQVITTGNDVFVITYHYGMMCIGLDEIIPQDPYPHFASSESQFIYGLDAHIIMSRSIPIGYIETDREELLAVFKKVRNLYGITKTNIEAEHDS